MREVGVIRGSRTTIFTSRPVCFRRAMRSKSIGCASAAFEADEEHQVRVIDVLVAAHRLVLAVRRHVAADGRGHAQARVPLHVVRADARLEELVRRVGLLREPLAGAVEADRVRAVLRDRGPESRSDEPHRLVPARRDELAALAHERAQAAIRRAHDLREQEALQTEEAAVMVLAVALDREHLAVADADVKPAAGAAVPAHALHPPLARGGEGVGGEAEPGEGRGGGGGLEEVAARGPWRSPGRGSLVVRVGLARCGEPVRRVAVEAACRPSRRRPSRRRRPPPPRVAALAPLRGGRGGEVRAGRAVAHEALHEQEAVRAALPVADDRGRRVPVARLARVGRGARAGVRVPSALPRARRRRAAATSTGAERRRSSGTRAASGAVRETGPSTGRPAAARGGTARRARAEARRRAPSPTW